MIFYIFLILITTEILNWENISQLNVGISWKDHIYPEELKRRFKQILVHCNKKKTNLNAKRGETCLNGTRNQSSNNWAIIYLLYENQKQSKSLSKYSKNKSIELNGMTWSV